jgi:hypothetical protein
MSASRRPARARALLVGFLGITTSLAAIVGGSTAVSASTAGQASVPGVKPVIQGLIDRQGAPSKGMLPYVHAYVVQANWSDLQPTAFGPIAANNAIDQAIARVRQPDFAKVGMVLKLRIFAGVNAPDWAKTLDGPSIPYVNNQYGGTTVTGYIGHFWTANFKAAYDDLMTKLAALYDNVPEVRELTFSRCTTIFDEPFVRQFGDKNNIANMQAAGYTTAADEQCISDSFAEQSVWQHTTSDMDFSPMTLIATPGTHDLAFTEQMMQLCRSTLGARCGIQNNALSTQKIADKTFGAMYTYMSKMGPPVIFQTATASLIGDPTQVLPAGAQYGANSEEMPKGYPKYSTTLLQQTATSLSANPTP